MISNEGVVSEHIYIPGENAAMESFLDNLRLPSRVISTTIVMYEGVLTGLKNDVWLKMLTWFMSADGFGVIHAAICHS